MASGSYDYVIVGGGTAGSVVAARLAENSDASVCLIEAGPTDVGLDDVAKLQRWPSLLGTDLDWNFVTESPPDGHPDLRASRARVLGGCSSHNTGIAYPATDADLQRWDDVAPGWGPNRSRRYFEQVAAKVPTTWAPDECAAATDFITACQGLGFPELGVPADASRVGVGRTTVNARWPHRISASQAYLHSQPHPNLDILTETRVFGIELDGDTAVAVNTNRGRIEAREEIILSAGAFGSPQLLLLSGIGPADELTALGITPRADLPVGEHLIDHPEGVITFEATKPLHHGDTMWVDSVLLAPSAHAGTEDPEMMIWFFSGDFDDITTVGGQNDEVTQRFSIAPDVAHPRSHGWVKLRSTNPLDPPRIAFNYFSDPEGYDQAVMLEALRLSRDIAASDPLNKWVQQEIAPGAHVNADADLIAYLRRSTYTAHHPSGTCQMAADGGVVNQRLQVHGVNNLRVVDASIFPSMIGLNLCITTLMIGERAADFILDSTRR